MHIETFLYFYFMIFQSVEPKNLGTRMVWGALIHLRGNHQSQRARCCSCAKILAGDIEYLLVSLSKKKNSYGAKARKVFVRWVDLIKSGFVFLFVSAREPVRSPSLNDTWHRAYFFVVFLVVAFLGFLAVTAFLAVALRQRLLL